MCQYYNLPVQILFFEFPCLNLKSIPFRHSKMHLLQFVRGGKSANNWQSFTVFLFGYYEYMF